ncbi:MAG TPA: hypothetical protein DSN98_08525 [Thermoplasmata archaeon]|jgi:hypothetical protein|nr:MAG TPA: hypothetical protein DSN98_08525 [Thermoplasmata archaeon]
MVLKDDPLFNYCICRCEKDKSDTGFTSPDNVMPGLKTVGDAESPDEMGIAFIDGKLVISGNDHKLVEYLKSIGITPVKMKVDICG